MIKLVLKDTEFIAMSMALMKVTPAQWDNIAETLKYDNSWRLASVENWVRLMDFLHHSDVDFSSTTHHESVKK